MSFEPPGYCPNCGEYVEKGSVSCDECGSCPETGWGDDSLYDGLDLPVEESESGSGPRDNRALSAAVSLALLALLVYVFVFR